MNQNIFTPSCSFGQRTKGIKKAQLVKKRKQANICFSGFRFFFMKFVLTLSRTWSSVFESATNSSARVFDMAALILEHFVQQVIELGVFSNNGGQNFAFGTDDDLGGETSDEVVVGDG